MYATCCQCIAFLWSAIPQYFVKKTGLSRPQQSYKNASPHLPVACNKSRTAYRIFMKFDIRVFFLKICRWWLLSSITRVLCAMTVSLIYCNVRGVKVRIGERKIHHANPVARWTPLVRHSSDRRRFRRWDGLAAHHMASYDIRFTDKKSLEDEICNYVKVIEHRAMK
jgi:hypothetical protein